MLEALNRFINKAIEPPKGRVLRLPTDPNGVYRYEAKPGQLDTIVPVEANRVFICPSLYALVDLANRREAVDGTAGKQAIFIGDGSVKLVFDTGKQTDIGVVYLNQTDEYKHLDTLVGEDIRSYSPYQFRIVLQTVLSEANGSQALIGKIQKIKTQSQSDAEDGADNGALTTSRAVRRDVVSEMPDFLNPFNVRRFTDPALNVRYQIHVMIMADTEKNRWDVSVNEGSWLKMKHETNLHTKEIIEEGLSKDASCAVFLGEYDLHSNYDHMDPPSGELL